MSAKGSKAPSKQGSGKAKRRHNPPPGHEARQPSKNKRARVWFEVIPPGHRVQKGKVVKG